MSVFRDRPRRDVERQLRGSRPRPDEGLVQAVEARLAREGAVPRSGRLRLGVALALTATLVTFAAVFGAASYAASSARSAVHAVQHIFRTAPHRLGSLSAAADQYHKVLLCHKGHEIRVDEHAVPAHLAHGDTFGKCPHYANLILGSSGPDRYRFRRSHQNLYIRDSGGTNTIDTGTGSDYIHTGSGKDTINADGGNNRISSGGGNDRIYVGRGHNTISSGAGNDWIWVRNGDSDYVNCGPGRDTVYADSAKIDYIAKNCEIVHRGKYKPTQK